MGNESASYYLILRVSVDATPAEIKSQYRTLAFTCHPDHHPGDKAAEDLFKQLNQAYEVLSDPERRKQYDESLVDGLRPGFDSRDDVSTRPDPPPAIARVQISSHEARAGTKRTIQVWLGEQCSVCFGHRESVVACWACAGQGSTVSSEWVHCQTCRGGGQLQYESGCSTCRGHGRWTVRGHRYSCEVCRGSGKTRYVGTCNVCYGQRQQLIECPPTQCRLCSGFGALRVPCENCHGSGTTTRAAQWTIRVPAGVKDGQRLRLRPSGAGEVFVEVTVRPRSRPR